MKEKILKCLRETEDYVSGQELCRMLDVSRTAIWKVMNQLKDEGYVIDAVKNKGYKLIQTPDIVTAEEVDSLLETEWAAHPGGCRASGVRQRQTGKTVAFTEGQRYLDEYSFKTSDSSDVSVYADTGGSHGSL